MIFLFYVSFRFLDSIVQFFFVFRFVYRVMLCNCNLSSKKLYKFYQMTWSFQIVPCLLCILFPDLIGYKMKKQIICALQMSSKSVEELKWIRGIWLCEIPFDNKRSFSALTLLHNKLVNKIKCARPLTLVYAL